MSAIRQSEVLHCLRCYPWASTPADVVRALNLDRRCAWAPLLPPVRADGEPIVPTASVQRVRRVLHALGTKARTT